jgi:glycosyltransferase involved in cell wall biosynthesis
MTGAGKKSAVDIARTVGPSKTPAFSIITPSFNNLHFLQRAHASIMDQDQVTKEHIIIDGGSTDGTVEWLETLSDATWISEPDRGMYDALNKGFQRAGGHYLAWLNSDEQYLPGALKSVQDTFNRQGDHVDILCGDALVTDTENRLLCIRKGEPLRYVYLVTDGMHALTCGIFFTRKLIDRGIHFNPAFRCAGEKDFFIKALHAGFKAKYIPSIFSAFTVTGANLGGTASARKETAQLLRDIAPELKLLRYPLRITRRVEKWRHGAYSLPKKITYQLYHKSAPPVKRRTYTAASPAFRWPEKS